MKNLILIFIICVGCSTEPVMYKYGHKKHHYDGSNIVETDTMTTMPCIVNGCEHIDTFYRGQENYKKHHISKWQKPIRNP